jgi:uncharacterized OB-fold protein
MTDMSQPPGQRPSRPQPVIGDLNRPFYDALARHELRLQRCDQCGLLRYPIASICPSCLSGDTSWELLSGDATVYSSVVFHQVYDQAFADHVPYNVAIIELAEGPRMISNVVGVPPSEVRVGDAVTFIATEIGDGTYLPQFVRAS